MNWEVHLEIIVTLLILIGGVGIFSHFKLWPSVATVRDVAELMNAKGGIILMLGGMSMVFFFTGMRWLYWSTMLIVEKKLGADNALVLNGFNWVSGAAFMGAFGAMLSAMKGEPPQPPIQTSSSTTTKTETAVTPP